MRNSQLFWGGILLLVGGFMLANEFGIRLPNGMSLMELLWPLGLILAGLWVLFGVFLRRSGKVDVENASIDLQGATSASLKISHGAGELDIHSGANPSELVHGSFAGGLDHKASRNGDRLEVRMRPAKDMMDFPFFGPRTQLDWDVALNSQVPTALTLNVGANKSMLDLRDLNLTDLKVETGASETKVTLPARGRYRADFDLGAASLEVTIPDGLSARIRASVGMAGVSVDETRFPRNGSYYQSPDFDSAANSVDMTIDAGAASIKVR
ncbi:hypothetical protein ANAEL_01005 [Anaerolineales bacterium]|nr:hypothetical protein ANAEL_01005 [Anaerolineales bacterium]